jgi:pimeloyl-ACP methyl ester carboxylesterase
MQSKYVTVRGREMHYVEWGADSARPDKPVLVMWHGLARCCRDFDIPAAHFASTYRVLCPDTIGRGWSQWAKEPEEYAMSNYVALAGEFINATCGTGTIVDWLGTSMGGVIAWNACAAGAPLAGRIRKLLLNDVGPELNRAAIEAIFAYASVPKVYDCMTDYVKFVQAVYEPNFGPQPDNWFTTIAEHTARRLPDGRVTQHFDMRCIEFVMKPLSASGGIWDEYDACTAQSILAVRGAKSALLSEEGHQKLAARGLKQDVKLVTLPDVGHAPTFNVLHELAVADEFFRPHYLEQP